MATELERWPLGPTKSLSEDLRAEAGRIKGEQQVREELIPQHRALSQRAAALATRFALQDRRPETQTPWVEVNKLYPEFLTPPQDQMHTWYALRLTPQGDAGSITDLLEKQTLPHPTDPKAKPLERQASRARFGATVTYECRGVQVDAPGASADVQPNQISEGAAYPRAAAGVNFDKLGVTLDTLEAELTKLASPDAVQQSAVL